MKDYYAILGVAKDATQDEIKSAYRKLAMKWHPDRNPDNLEEAKNKFAEINEAYETLGNPEKREQYDHPSPFGKVGGMGGGGYQQWTDPNGNMHFSFTSDGGGIPPEFMERMGGFGFGGFPGFGPFGGFGGRRVDPNAPRPGENILLVLDVPFMDAINGCTKKVKLYVEEDCGCLNGCDKCNHTGRTKKVVTLDVKVPRGCPDGQRLRVAGQGNKGYNGGPPGDILFQVSIGRHDIFVRDGFDVGTKVSVPFETFVLGGKIEIPTLDGKMEHELPPYTKPGKVLVFKGKGSPIMNSMNAYGELKVLLDLEMPSGLSKRERELLEEYRDERRKNGK